MDQQGTENNTVAISGATGFLGRELSHFFKQSNQEVIPVTRDDFLLSDEDLAEKLNGVGAVFNLAGAPILQKWTKKAKEEIFNSRVETTRKLVRAIEKTTEKPGMFFSVSAVGIYDVYEVHDEFSTAYASDFLAEVCKAWEHEALKLYGKYGIKLIIGRLGVVLGRSGGALPKVAKAMKMGIGNKVGEGYQIFPYIHISDFLGILWYLWKKSSCTGVFNIVAPEMISNEEFANALKTVMKKKVLFNIPEWALKLRFGEGTVMFTSGQKVLPVRLKEENFPFMFPDITDALKDLLG